MPALVQAAQTPYPKPVPCAEWPRRVPESIHQWLNESELRRSGFTQELI